MATTKKAAPAAKKEEPKAVVPAPQAALPAVSGGSERLKQVLAEIKDNLGSVENYLLPRAKITEEGFQLLDDDEPVNTLEGVIIHAKKMNVYYAKPYNPSDVSPPDCSSQDGVKPDPSVKNPVHATCKGCPMAEFGTNAMKSGKACRNLKPLFLIRKTEDGLSIIPRQITVTPTSLKAANSYLMDLTERGISYRKVMTKMVAEKEDKNSRYATLSFYRGEKLSAEEIADVEALRAQWLPIMDAQSIDQNELDKAEAPATVASSQGEF